MAKLISFDIDGTLEVGNPPGCITIARVRQALELGYIIGSCSDWPVSHQRRMWMKHDIPVAFTVLKHQLDQVKAEFSAEHYVHIGDTNIDRQYAERNGFVYTTRTRRSTTSGLPRKPYGAWIPSPDPPRSGVPARRNDDGYMAAARVASSRACRGTRTRDPGVNLRPACVSAAALRRPQCAASRSRC